MLGRSEAGQRRLQQRELLARMQRRHGLLERRTEHLAALVALGETLDDVHQRLPQLLWRHALLQLRSQFQLLVHIHPLGQRPRRAQTFGRLGLGGGARVGSRVGAGVGPN